MSEQDRLYDTAIEIQFLIDEARAILINCSLNEDQKDELGDVISSAQTRYYAYRDAVDSDDPKMEELNAQASADLEKMSQTIMQWSGIVEHAEILRAASGKAEELRLMRSQAQDVLDSGDLPAMYCPSLEDMVSDMGERIEEFDLLPTQTPLEGIQALGELETSMTIFSDSLFRYKQLADSEENPEE